VIKAIAVGDVHGQWPELWRVLKASAACTPTYEPTPAVIEGRYQVVCVGDLVHYKDERAYANAVGAEPYDPADPDHLRRAAKAQIRELYRFKRFVDQAAGNVTLILGNHDTLRGDAEKFGISFHHVPITKDTKSEREQVELALLREHDIDTVVLARYMQILSADFLDAFGGWVINIHHSFLPAFVGAKPYQQAHARGVKIIGATSHYVTPDLDQGPIIAQDVIRVSHRDSVDDFVRQGKDLEKIVLARAVWHHVRHRVLTYNNKTVVF